MPSSTGVYARTHGSLKGQQRPAPVVARAPAKDTVLSSGAAAGAAVPGAASPGASPSIPAQVAALAHTRPVRNAGVALAGGVLLRLAFALGLAVVSRKGRRRLRRAF